MATLFDIDDPRLAAVAWSRLAEPGDLLAGTLVTHLGVSGALHWVIGESAEHLENLPLSLAGGGAMAQLRQAAARWAAALCDLNPRADLTAGEALGARLVLPMDKEWPPQIQDLGAAAPHALWVLGCQDLAALSARAVSLVGSRAATSYGEHVTGDLAAGLCDRGYTVVSGGAYGIDAAAHRAALVSQGATIAFMAGGLERLYPPGNNALLRAVVESGRGSIVSEVPPGAVPFRSRFIA
ncbi:MAG: DNA-protecting protein DprA, partial [Cellulomonadaceae bacterium]|nr:DNA-protecting protein DprA [Cellulomonadaceae bacterium]